MSSSLRIPSIVVIASSDASSHALVQAFNQVHPSLKQFVIRQVLFGPSVQHFVQTLSLCATKFLIAEIGIVNNLCNLLNPRVLDREFFLQGLERAVLSPVAESLWAKHVKWDRLGVCLRVCIENEARLWIDEATDQPRR